MSKKLMIKVMLFGDDSSGREVLAKRFLSGTFSESTKFTHGVDFHLKSISFKGMSVSLQIWEVTNEPRFIFMLPQYCIGAKGAVIFFDISNSKTLDNISEWSQILRRHDEDIPIMLVGNQTVSNKPREVSREEGEELVKKFKFSKYIEISTKTGKGIDRLFQDLTELLTKNRKNN
jgi:small GTP-binding protein